MLGPKRISCNNIKNIKGGSQIRVTSAGRGNSSNSKSNEITGVSPGQVNPTHSYQSAFDNYNFQIKKKNISSGISTNESS